MTEFEKLIIRKWPNAEIKIDGNVWSVLFNNRYYQFKVDPNAVKHNDFANLAANRIFRAEEEYESI